MARVEPNVKEQAEEIMDMLGIPVSVVINTLYKQIIMTDSLGNEPEGAMAKHYVLTKKR